MMSGRPWEKAMAGRNVSKIDVIKRHWPKRFSPKRFMGCSGFNPVSYLGARQAYSDAQHQKARSYRGRIQLHVMVFSAQMLEQPRGELVIQTIAMPKDTNPNGDIFGGWLTSQMDLGSAILAAKTAQARVVTVAMEGMSFLQPVRVGDTVRCYARVDRIGQTFCYREVAELYRQGFTPPIFSIRNPRDEPAQDWDARIVRCVHYLPEEKELLDDVRRASKKGRLAPEIVASLDEWGRRTDFLRLYQAVHVGLRLQEAGIGHVHAHFAGMAARTAFWIAKLFPIPFSFTAHANDIFAPSKFEIGLDKMVGAARVVVTETDYAEKFLRERFPERADRIHRVYNGLNLAEFGRATFSSDPPSIVAIGRLIVKKGFANLIRACALLVERGRSFQCNIFGEGPLENQLRVQIEQLGLKEFVRLPGL